MIFPPRPRAALYFLWSTCVLGLLLSGCAPEREPLPNPAEASAAAHAPYPLGLAATHMQRAR